MDSEGEFVVQLRILLNFATRAPFTDPLLFLQLLTTSFDLNIRLTIKRQNPSIFYQVGLAVDGLVVQFFENDFLGFLDGKCELFLLQDLFVASADEFD